MRSELRALRADNERLENRVQRLEDDQVILRSAHSKPSASEEDQPWTGEAKMPDLTVVKLKPRAQAAPPIRTETDVQEPSSDDLQVLLASAKSRSDDGADDDAEDELPMDPNGADAAYDRAMTALKTGNVSGAVLQLQTFAQENPRHAQSDNALYFSGVGLMALGDFDGAAKAFQRVLDEYPAGDARMQSLLKLGDCRVRQNQKDDARALYAKLISTYPGTTAASEAEARLSQITQ